MTETRPKYRTKTKNRVPPILPRERLTKKAFAAISKYAGIKAGGLPVHHLMVKYTLQAERMRRAELYAWLEGQGYLWRPKSGSWS